MNTAIMENFTEVPQKENKTNKNRSTTYVIHLSHSWVYISKRKKSAFKRDQNMPMFIVSLVKTTRIQVEPQYPLIEE
jgi:hypothetical protein